MKTEISYNGTKWVLMIKRDGQMFRAWTFIKLTEAMDMAFTLQLHISSINMPPGYYEVKG